MGETLAETRVEIEAGERSSRGRPPSFATPSTSGKRFQENPALVIGWRGRRASRSPASVRRRRPRPPTVLPDRSGEGLRTPPLMQSWVDHMTSSLGPRAADARHALSEEPAVAEQSAQVREGEQKAGEPDRRGPTRSAAKCMEGIRDRRRDRHGRPARKAVERFLSGEPPSGLATLDAAGTAGGAAEPDLKHAKNVTKPKSERAVAAKAEKAGKAEYSGMSSRVP